MGIFFIVLAVVLAFSWKSVPEGTGLAIILGAGAVWLVLCWLFRR